MDLVGNEVILLIVAKIFTNNELEKLDRIGHREVLYKLKLLEARGKLSLLASAD